MQELVKKDHKLQEHIQEMKWAVIRSRAGSMNRSYSSWFECFQVFCEKLKVPLVRVGVPEAAFFAQSICREGGLGSLVAQVMSAIAWHFLIADRVDPMKHKLITALVAAARHSNIKDRSDKRGRQSTWPQLRTLSCVW